MLKDAVFNRRAIFTALHAYFDDASLQKVINAWDQFCANGQPSVQRFLAELCKSEELKQKRSDMLRSILHALSLPASQLLPNPPQTVVAAAATSSKLRTDLAFNVLLKQLLLRAPAAAQSAIRLNLGAKVRRLQLPDMLLQQLLASLAGSGEIAVSVADAYALRQIINVVYMELCDQLGPVDTDQLLAQAVSASQLHHPELNEALTQIL